MSLSALSTELDAHIIGFIHDQGSLSALSRVSKYYRRITEPFLYDRIEFRCSKESSISWLLITLLYRPELAQHIHFISFDEDTFTPEHHTEASNAFLRHFRLQFHAISEIIKGLLGSRATDVFQNLLVAWFLESLPMWPAYEGALVLILYLAVNVEEISILVDWEISHLVECFLYDLSIKAQRNDSKINYLQKLRHMHLCGFEMVYFPLLSSLESLTVQPCASVVELPFEEEDSAVAPTYKNLRSLKLDAVRIWDHELANILSTGYLQNVTKLCLIDSVWGWEGDDFNDLVQTMVLHLPKLRYLEWRYTDFNKNDEEIWSHPPLDLAELLWVEFLHLDYAILTGEEETPDLATLENLATTFPPNLDVHIEPRTGSYIIRPSKKEAMEII